MWEVYKRDAPNSANYDRRFSRVRIVRSRGKGQESMQFLELKPGAEHQSRTMHN